MPCSYYLLSKKIEFGQYFHWKFSPLSEFEPGTPTVPSWYATMDDFRADAQTDHVIHETPKQIWLIFKNEKKWDYQFDAYFSWGRGVRPVCPLSRGLWCYQLSYPGLDAN